VDDQQIIQTIPDSEVAYHVGAKNYKRDGERLIADSNLSANYYLIGFEMCVNSDGNWGKTYKNAVLLAAHLLHKYRFGLNDLYRHHDITGKDCPRMMLSTAAWERFRSDVGKEMKRIFPRPQWVARVNASGLNVRRGPSVRYGVVDVLTQNEVVEISGESGAWKQIGQGRWVYGSYLTILRVVQDALIQNPIGANIRSGPSMAFPVVDTLPNSAWISILGKAQNWYAIGRGRWVYQSLLKIVNIQIESVIGTSFLNYSS